MTRTDIHKPSLLNPAEYTFLAAFYQGASDAMYDAYSNNREYGDYIQDGAVSLLDGTQVFEGNFKAKGSCDHCGAHFNHGVLFQHIPTGDLIHVGHICADDTIGLPSKAAAMKRAAEKAAAAAKAEAEALARADEWKRENPAIAEFLQLVANEESAYRDAMGEWNDKGCVGRAPVPPVSSHPFLHDMIHTVNRYGSLSEKQVNAVYKFKAGYEKRIAGIEERKAAEVVPTTPIETGRRVITGTIVHTKFQDSDFGSTPKMLVIQADGNKVWSTVPEHGFPVSDTEGYTLPLDALKGREVEFTATIKVKDDEHFGIASRPTNMTTKEAATA